MTEYLIYFNQQWVGDHTEEWFRARGPLAMAVVNEMKAAGEYVFAGGLEEEVGPVFSADATSGTLMFTDGPYVETKEFLGGLTVVDVADDEAAKMWAGKIAEACGWPQEVRRFKPRPRSAVAQDRRARCRVGVRHPGEHEPGSGRDQPRELPGRLRERPRPGAGVPRRPRHAHARPQAPGQHDVARCSSFRAKALDR